MATEPSLRAGLELHRYTITSEGASKGYFRLVEDPAGAWCQWAEVADLLRAQPPDLPPYGTESGEDVSYTAKQRLLLQEASAALAGKNDVKNEEFCLGCGKPTNADCGCPAGTGWRTRATALFMPLKGEYFDAFANGSKRDELRRYGPRWNERTCAVGRRVVLSRGYGNASRLEGRIWKFKKQHGSTFGSTYRADIERCFGTLDIDIACIGIEIAGHRMSAAEEASWADLTADGGIHVDGILTGRAQPPDWATTDAPGVCGRGHTERQPKCPACHDMRIEAHGRAQPPDHKLDCCEYHHHQPDKGCCALDCPACIALRAQPPPAPDPPRCGAWSILANQQCELADGHDGDHLATGAAPPAVEGTR